MRRDLGDFQTPPALVDAVLESLGFGAKWWPRVLEPTCGRGNFIQGLLRLPRAPIEVQGVELQKAYVRIARQIEAKQETRIVIREANLFGFDLRRDLEWTRSGPLLVVGNPPWVTNAELSCLGSDNLPVKANIRGLRGIEALTGESNFDIAEYIWLKLIRELASEEPTIALLCKTAVARNVLRFACDAKLPFAGATIRRIDAQRWFGAAVDACLFCVQVAAGGRCYEAAVFQDLSSTQPDSVMGIVNGRLVSDSASFRHSSFAAGNCPLTWRQGLKHDAASVMELKHVAGSYWNKLGERVNVEAEYVFPLLKSSDVFHQRHRKPRLSVVVTQQELGEDTSRLESRAPNLWSYLISHRVYFEQRKSSIYQGQPSFGIFGIGPYSFAPFKVAISGLYKSPQFCALGPVEGRPVMLDDTCYFIPCHSSEQAALLVSLLNDPTCLDLIRSIVFWDSKRPITKKVLQCIDLGALLEHLDRDQLLRRADDEHRGLAASSGLQEAVWPASLNEFLVERPPTIDRTSQLTLFG